MTVYTNFRQIIHNRLKEEKRYTPLSSNKISPDNKHTGAWIQEQILMAD